MTAAEICRAAAVLVEGERARQHGPLLLNHGNIAAMWNAYLSLRLSSDGLSALDVAHMMALVKIARTQLGEYDEDNYVDLAGYAGVAGQIAATMKRAAEHSFPDR